MQLNIREAKSKLVQLAEMACEGEKVIIAKAGEPFVQLIPYTEVAPRKFGLFKGCFNMSVDFEKATNEKNGALFDSNE